MQNAKLIVGILFLVSAQIHGQTIPVPCQSFDAGYCGRACGTTAISATCSGTTGDCMCDFPCPEPGLASAICPAQSITTPTDQQACFGDCSSCPNGGAGVLCDSPDSKYTVCTCMCDCPATTTSTTTTTTTTTTTPTTTTTTPTTTTRTPTTTTTTPTTTTTTPTTTTTAAASQCQSSITYCPLYKYFTMGPACANETGVAIKWTTLGSLLIGQSATGLGLTTTTIGSLSGFYTTLGSMFGAQTASGGISTTWTTLGQAMFG